MKSSLRVISLFCILVLVIGTFAACGGEETTTAATTPVNLLTPYINTAGKPGHLPGFSCCQIPLYLSAPVEVASTKQKEDASLRPLWSGLRGSNSLSYPAKPVLRGPHL